MKIQHYVMALVALMTMLAEVATTAEPTVTDVALLEDHLKVAFEQYAEGDTVAALRSIRSASQCDSVEDVVESKPFGVKTGDLIQFHLSMALKEIRSGRWWRAAIISQRMAGCDSATLRNEAVQAMPKHPIGGIQPASQPKARVNPAEWVTDWNSFWNWMVRINRIGDVILLNSLR